MASARLIRIERRVEDAEAEGVAQGTPRAAQVDGGLRHGGGTQGAPQKYHTALKDRVALGRAITRRRTAEDNACAPSC